MYVTPDTAVLPPDIVKAAEEGDKQARETARELLHGVVLYEHVLSVEDGGAAVTLAWLFHNGILRSLRLNCRDDEG